MNNIIRNHIIDNNNTIYNRSNIFKLNSCFLFPLATTMTIIIFTFIIYLAFILFIHKSWKSPQQRVWNSSSTNEELLLPKTIFIFIYHLMYRVVWGQLPIASLFCSIFYWILLVHRSWNITLQWQQLTVWLSTIVIR